MTRQERDWLERVKRLPCGVCGEPGPSEAHHIREGQGAAQRAGHFLTVPLCPACHRGPQGIHGDRSRWRIYRVDELYVLNATIPQIALMLAAARQF